MVHSHHILLFWVSLLHNFKWVFIFPKLEILSIPINSSLITPFIIFFYLFLIYDNFRGSVIIFDSTALPIIEKNEEFLIGKIGKVFNKNSTNKYIFYFVFQIESYINGSFSNFKDNLVEEIRKTFLPSFFLFHSSL